MTRPGEGMTAGDLGADLLPHQDPPQRVRVVTPTGAEYRVSFVQVEEYPDGTIERVLYTTDRIADPEGRL